MKTKAATRLTLTTAMPQLVESQDFGLGTPQINKALRTGFLADPSYKEIRFAGTKFGSVTYGKGEISLFLTHKERISYFVQLTKTKVPGLGTESVTQTAVWRALGLAPSGITHKVFAAIITKYGSVVSDSRQTEDGRKFWSGRLIEFFTLGHKVGFLANQSLIYVDSEEDLNEYFDSQGLKYPWGRSEHYANFRFVIFKEKRQ